MVKLFVDYMSVKKSGIMHNTKLKRILASSVLAFHKEFLGIIGNKPYGKYRYPTHHPFNKKLISVLSDNLISMVTFCHWQN